MTKHDFFARWILGDHVGTIDQKIKQAESAWNALEEYFAQEEEKSSTHHTSKIESFKP